MLDEDFFLQTRAQIQHEDLLLNNRMTWLLTLQGLLFTAYGFSLGAEATVLTSQGTDEAKRIFLLLVHDVRLALCGLGVMTDLLLLLGIFAAAKSISKLVAGWDMRTVESRATYPQIIGAIGRTGSQLGLTPTYFMPVICACAWIWITRYDGIVVYLTILLYVVGIICLAYFIAIAMVRFGIVRPKTRG